MKTIAILDTETTDVDPSKGHLLEVACVLWSVEHRAVIEARSWLLENAKLEANPAIAVNGIAPALLVHGYSRWNLEEGLEELTKYVDAFTAWNADFDRAWIAEHLPKALGSQPWFDAMDLEWPRSSESRSLVATALAHGVGVVDAHRALTDCLTVARLFERVAEMKLAEPDDHTDDRNVRSAFDVWLARALRPKVHVEVADKGFDEARNTLVKAHGFRWEPAPVKAWRRKMFAEDAEKLPFRVVEVTP